MLSLRQMAKHYDENKWVVYFYFYLDIWYIQCWKIRHIENRLSRCFCLHFKRIHWNISSICYRKACISSLIIMFYHNRTTVVYKVIRYLIHYLIDNFILLAYLGILQHTLSPYKNKVEKQSSMIFLGWEFLKLWLI